MNPLWSDDVTSSDCATTKIMSLQQNGHFAILKFEGYEAKTFEAKWQECCTLLNRLGAFLAVTKQWGYTQC